MNAGESLLRRCAAGLGVEPRATLSIWAWRLFVLPRSQARPWPRPLRRLALWCLLQLMRGLEVDDPRRGRDWARAFLLRPASNPPGPWPLSGLAARLWQLLPAPLRAAVAAQGQRLRRFNPAPWLAQAEDAADDLLKHRRSGYALIACGALFLLLAATTPFSLGQQMAIFLCTWLIALAVRRLPGNIPTLVLVMLSLLATARYAWWRLTQTLDLQPGASFTLGIGLVLAELYTWSIMLLGYIQNAWPLQRKPQPLPADTRLWPSVDIYIPTYNEPLGVVRPTVLAALALDWPRDKLKVYLLDDGRRGFMKQFAAGCGAEYLVRSNNAHAKAGNLNHAMGVTAGEFIAIFDCDHVPVRSFLQTTMGWFLKDPLCAMVQTPHHFFSPDPFEKNLGTFRRVPNEGSLFYGLVQDGNDLWNATFFCGSCAVLRRAPLMEIGGIAVETVTEDAHTALKLHRRGYTTAYLGMIQAAGLATESLSGHVGQRIRWARGMAQIFRLDNPFLGKGLSLFQRLCYSNAMLHFFYGIPRLAFLSAPLAYLLFELHIINAAATTLAAYVLPHLVQSNLANSRMQGRFRHSFWAEAYETVLSWYIALPTTLAMINPRAGSFNVTAKGGLTQRSYFDWTISTPYVVLIALNLAGALLAVPRLLWWNSYESGTVILNLAWTLFNLVMLGTAVGVAAEARQIRQSHRVPLRMPASLYLPDGRAVRCEAEDYSTGGLGLRLAEPMDLPQGQPLHVALSRGSREFAFPCRIAALAGTRVGLRLDKLDTQQEKDLITCTFGRADAWLDWSAGIAQDRPAASIGEVLAFGALGYVRLARGMLDAISARWMRRRPLIAG
jgi:cellulose synthase (UDP-forming)